MNTESEALKSRRKPVQQRSRITQGAILDAFVRLLVEKGYVRLTIRDIALVAGVGIGTLYEYFPGKNPLLLIVLSSDLVMSESVWRIGSAMLTVCHCRLLWNICLIN